MDPDWGWSAPNPIHLQVYPWASKECQKQRLLLEKFLGGANAPPVLWDRPIWDWHLALFFPCQLYWRITVGIRTMSLPSSRRNSESTHRLHDFISATTPQPPSPNKKREKRGRSPTIPSTLLNLLLLAVVGFPILQLQSCCSCKEFKSSRYIFNTQVG